MEEKKEKNKAKILIVDDSEMNREMLTDILIDDYDILEAENGRVAITMMEEHIREIDLVLLDIVMPDMDGFDVLTVMNKNHWINFLPVIMISVKNSSATVEKAYELGVVEYIRRPYESFLIHHRIRNTLMLFGKQKRLMNIVEQQVYDKEKDNRMMINILGHIVEFRNGESGMHIQNVETITKLLLRALVKRTDKYNLSDRDILLIGTAATLHDIGKISIDEKILNKPGRLTKEEFEIIKTHSMIGATMLNELLPYQDNELIKVAYEICRWHHERYDGKGYPDGLVGEEIPISAQVVALADVYDALTSERCYKKAIPHENAINMILNGECGTFSHLLIQCLDDISDKIKDKENIENKEEIDNSLVLKVTDELVEDETEQVHDSRMDIFENEHEKRMFFTADIKEIQFEYDARFETVNISPYGAEVLGIDRIITHPLDKVHEFISKEELDCFANKVLKETNYKNPEFSVKLHVGKGENKPLCLVKARSLWSQDDEHTYMGVLGRVIQLDEQE